MAGHRAQLRNNHSPHILLQRSWNKHGGKAFVFQVLEWCSPDKCLEREQHWIDYYRSADPRFGYNTCPIAGSRRGTTASDETKKKLALVWKGRKHTEETKEKMRAAAVGRNKGRVLSEEHKAKIGSASAGRRHTKETRDKISASNLGKNKGKSLPKSAETRARMSEAAKARWLHRSRKFSEETKRRMSESARNRLPESVETRIKKSEAAKVRELRKRLEKIREV